MHERTNMGICFVSQQCMKVVGEQPSSCVHASYNMSSLVTADKQVEFGGVLLMRTRGVERSFASPIFLTPSILNNFHGVELLQKCFNSYCDCNDFDVEAVLNLQYFILDSICWFSVYSIKIVLARLQMVFSVENIIVSLIEINSWLPVSAMYCLNVYIGYHYYTLLLQK